MRHDAGRSRGWEWYHRLLWCLGVLIILGRPDGVSLSWAQPAQLMDGIAAIVHDEIITITDVREAMAPEAEQLVQQFAGMARNERLKA
ncbi:MAG: hypothetical protein HW397_632 [Dehalococcoidia bacterium]|nr:hypothetical protein [Dehalococcoidia bacterium]